MSTLNQHLDLYPRGRSYTYAVRIRGLPHLFTDNRVNWNYYAQHHYNTTAKPFLARTDWKFEFESNPLDPLAVGNGVNIELVNDPGGLVRNLFAPMREMDFELTLDETTVTPTKSQLTFEDVGSIDQGTLLYWGLETMIVNYVEGNEVALQRGAFGSIRRRQQATNTSSDESYVEGASGLVPLETLTSHPTVWRGRYVDILMGVIDDDDTLGEVWPIWAGRVDQFSLDGRVIRVACDPLTACLTKDNWPSAMPKGSLQGGGVKLFVHQEDLHLYFAASTADLSTADDGKRYELGTYNTADPAVFTAYTADPDGEWMTLERIAQLIQDTIIYGTISGSATSGIIANSLLNNFSISVLRSGEDDAAFYTLFARNESFISFVIQDTHGILARLHGFVLSPLLPDILFRWAIPSSQTTTFGTYGRGAGYTLAAVGQSTLACYMDIGGDPFNEVRGGCFDFDSKQMRGFLRLSEGENVELISFRNSGIGQDGVFFADIGERGLGGTKSRDWGGGADPVSIEQVPVVYVGESMSMAELILYLLTSTAADGTENAQEDPISGPNGNYDYLGEWIGLGVPEDLVDVEGISTKLALTDMPRPQLFWVEEAGKGKDAVAELLKANGIYFVTRRFTRGGIERFGLSVDIIDVPAPSRFNNQLTDADISAGKRPRVNVNERLIINNIVVSPHYRFGSDVGDTGGKRYDRAEQSIRKYGATKALEFSPNVIYNLFSSQFSGSYTNPEQISIAIAASIGARWFGAFASGNYTLESDSPHVGWKYQAGDRILVVLTGVPNPNGTESYESVIAKVVDVDHEHGKGSSARLTLRFTTSQSCELAPCLMVVGVDGADIRIANGGYANYPSAYQGLANSWSWITTRGTPYDIEQYLHPTAASIPPFSDDAAPAGDYQWFNPERHTDNDRLLIRLWPRGNYAEHEDFEVLSVTYDENAVDSLNPYVTLTLDGAPSSDLTDSLTGDIAIPLVGTFASWGDPSALRSTYAHLGSNDQESKLGGTSKAKKWV